MDLAISGLGMATSLGGVVRGSAAQRAGLTRPTTLDSFYVADDEEYVPVTARRALSGSEPSSGIDLWLRMALEATGDLLRYSPVPDPSDARFWRRTAVIVAAPVMEADRFGRGDDVGERLRAAFLDRLVEALALSVPVDQRFVLPYGQSAVARALAMARAQIEGLRCDRALIVAVDSWVDPPSMFWLGSQDRLRRTGRPDGLSPSEAAASILVECANACVKRGGRVDALVEAEIFVGDPRREGATAAATGHHLAMAIRRALGAPEASNFVGDVYADLNGEAHRATAWACAEARLQRRIDFARSRLVLPCSELGDMGAAGAAVSMCLGVRSFARGYAVGPRVLICSISEHGDSSAILVATPTKRVDPNIEQRSGHA
jgi:3-oxoacyl-[acyl-carrier-protein] synthase I